MISATRPSPSSVVPQIASFPRRSAASGLTTAWRAPSQRVDREPRVLAVVLDDDDVLAPGRSAPESEQVAQANVGEHAAAEREYAARVRVASEPERQLDAFPHGLEREDERLAPGIDGEPLDDRERERHANRDRAPHAVVARHLHVAFERRDVVTHDVHADAAPGEVGHGLRRSRSRGRRRAGRPRASLIDAPSPRDETRRARAPREDAVAAKAGAVVADLDDELPGLVARAQRDRPRGILARGSPRVGRLDSVIDRVPDHVREGPLERLEDRRVHFDVVPLDDEPPQLPVRRREIAHRARLRSKRGADGDEAQAHHLLSQIVEVTLGLRQRVAGVGARRSAPSVERDAEPRPGDRELLEVGDDPIEGA